MIDRAHDLPISKQAGVLRISRGSVYYLPRPVADADLAIMRRLDRRHLEYPFAGSRMLRGLLAAEGCKIGRRHVKTLMRRMGIEALYRRARTTKPEPGHKIYPYLLRGVFGAVCPEHGSGAALVLPFCNTEAMQLHLDEIATRVTPGAHAILILDQAGWHRFKELRIPSNLSLLPLPPRAPELNSQETSGNSCARTGCQTEPSNPLTISSITAATLGTR